MKISKLFSIAGRFSADVVSDPLALFQSAVTCFGAGVTCDEGYEILASDHKIAVLFVAAMTCCVTVFSAKSVKETLIENRRPIAEDQLRMYNVEPK